MNQAPLSHVQGHWRSFVETELNVDRSSHLTSDSVAVLPVQGLADRKDLAFVAFERSRAAIVISDCRQKDNPIVMANPAFLAMTGYSASEVIGRNCRFLQGEDTSQTVLGELRAALISREPVTVELVNYRKDGAPFLNQLSVSPIRDHAGDVVYFFGSQLDVTRQRKIQDLERSERLLLREVDHRAMNALALVQAIVGLSRTDTVERYAASVRGRVQALARAHAILAERGWGSAPLSDLITTEIPLRFRDRVTVKGPQTMVRAQLVQPLVLFFHELSANAAVHGSLSSPEGLVAVSWTGTSEQRIELRWQETGGPSPAALRVPGFGVTITRALVERQLQGELMQDWGAPGLITQIAFSNHPA